MATLEAGGARSAAPLAAALLDASPVGIACLDAGGRVVLRNRQFADALRVAEGADLREAPDPLGRLAVAAGQVVAGGEPQGLELGPAGWARVSRVDEQHAAVVLAAPGVAAEPSADAAAAGRLALLVAGDAEEPAVFAGAAEEAARMLGAEAAAVMRRVADERSVVVGVWRADGTRGLPVNAEIDVDRTGSALGRALATRRPARADGYGETRGSLPGLMRSIGLRSAVAAPVLHEGEVWGALVVSTTREQAFAPGSEERLVPLAQLVAAAVTAGERRRRLADSRRRLVEAADRSRRRLEGALHEGAQQHLLSLLLTLKVARAAADSGSEPARLLDAALAEADAVHDALTELARGLHPAVLTERGLPAAIQALVTSAPIPVSLRALPARRFSDAVEATAYAVVAEGLANAERHAHATDVEVHVQERGAELLAEVRDNGIGGATPRSGASLRALADRVAAVGGRIELESPRGEGTTLRAVLPLDA